MGVLVGLVALPRRLAGLGLGIGQVALLGLDELLETVLGIALARAFRERRLSGRRDALRAGAAAAHQAGELLLQIGGELLIARLHAGHAVDLGLAVVALLQPGLAMR